MSAKKFKKNKDAAVMLSLFTGPFAWLYIYAKASKRFWSFLVSQAFILLVSFLLRALVDYYLAIWFLYLFLMYLWSVLDIAIRPDRYYSRFYKKEMHTIRH